MKISAEIIGVSQTFDLRTGSIAFTAQVVLDLPGSPAVSVPLDGQIAQAILDGQAQPPTAPSRPEPVSFGGDVEPQPKMRPEPPRGVPYVTGDTPPVPRARPRQVPMDAAGNPITAVMVTPEEAPEYDEDGVRAG